MQSYPYPAAPGAAYGQYPYHAGPGTPYGEYDVQYDDEGNPKKSKRPKVELPESVTKSPAYQAARDKKAGGIAMLSIGGAGVVGGAVWALTTSLNNAFTWGGGSPNNTGVTGGLVIMLTSGALMAGGGVVMAIGRKEQRRIENDYLNGAPPKLAVGLTPSGVMFGGTF